MTELGQLLQKTDVSVARGQNKNLKIRAVRERAEIGELGAAVET